MSGGSGAGGGRVSPGRAVRTQQHLSRWLLAYALGAIALGMVAGYPMRGWSSGHTGALSTTTTVAVFLVIYPMMVNLRFEEMAKAGRNVRGLVVALVFNFVWAPAIGYLLATWLLHDPLLAIGFLLVMVVPCSSMAIAYTGLAKGDVELATVIVGISFVVAIVAVPAWMALFAAGYSMPLPMSTMVSSILTVLLAPMLAGWATRALLVRFGGRARLAGLQPVFSAASMMAMSLIIFLIFFAKAAMIWDRWATVLLLLVPNAVFMVATLAVATWLDRRIGMSYEEHMAVVFASAGKNNGTAIAIAATAFSPLVAVPAATMPIFQVVLMVGYVKLAPRLRGYFAGHRLAEQVPG